MAIGIDVSPMNTRGRGVFFVNRLSHRAVGKATRKEM